LLAALFLPASALDPGNRQHPRPRSGPPGLVLVEGGRTPLGTPREEVLALAERHRKFLGNLAGEQPRSFVPVDDFWIGASEVTNEQYEVFVRSSRRRPPLHWADAQVLEHARRAYLGRPPEPGSQHGKWEPQDWWRENWREVAWSVPPEISRSPVVHVSCEDAEAYARWAGLRLPTEAEWTRAARGAEEDHAYPWGREWRGEACANLENAGRAGKEGRPPSIGSYPGGATAGGVHDLVGSVWEWTSSPYRPFLGYRPLAIAPLVKSLPPERIDAPFGQGGRVALGGSFATRVPSLACRIASRAGIDPSGSLPDLGFRCAWAPRPGRDSLQAAAEAGRFDLAGTEFAFDRTLGIERWEIAEGDPTELGVAAEPARESRPSAASVPSAGLFPGYAAIASHQTVAFAPVRKIEFAGAEVRRAARERSIVLGLLLTDLPLLDPPLPPGLYTVSFRAKGGRGRERDPHDDPTRDRILLSGVGLPPTSAARGEPPAERGDLPAALAGAMTLDTARGSIRLEAAVLTKSEFRALGFALELRFPEGALSGSWVR
ncbi:MAG: SUMF1/EgtB/PvdO family nonheme iron enzyme, partial [Planctomycetota bacterium]